jgi:FkbH-like protein
VNLHWLPIPEDFRGKLKAAAQLQDAAQRLEALAELSRHQLDPLQTMQIARLIGDADASTSGGWSRVKLALLASHTVEHLVPAIRVAGLRRNILVDTYVCNYGQYRQELIDTGSKLHSFAPQFILLAIAAQESLEADLATEAADRQVEELRGLWRTARQSFKAAVIQQTFLDVTESLFGNYDRLIDTAPSQIVERLNTQITSASREDSVLLLDIDRHASRGGRDDWFDLTHWYSSKLMIAPRAAPLYGDQLLRIVAARLGQSKKCLVLDLDNTVWGGVVGDDGMQGLVLGQGSAQGEAHLALQRYAKQLHDRGVILAVCSKNEHVVAAEAFAGHPEMLLKMSDVAVFVANWTDKAENLRAIATRLNIGLDSLVFVDDNPAERQRVRGALPQVSVPELPDDVAGYVRSIADAGYFESVSFTEDDRNRAAQYSANSEREVLRSSAESIEEFRRGLGMIMQYGPFTQVDLARVGQLINKTNQFNVSVRRYTQQEIEAVAQDDGCLSLQFRLRDRFGDNGLIAAMICRPAAGALLQLETWVMSCRVFGRDAEIEIMNLAVDAATSRGFQSIETLYVQTPKNGLIRDLLPRLGFVEAQSSAEVGSGSRWTLHLPDYVRQHTFIQRESQPL